MKSRIVARLLLLGVVAGAIAFWTARERTAAGHPAVVFSDAQPGCAIVVPARAIEPERRAAALLQTTLAKAAGLSATRFPIQAEGRTMLRSAIFVGATRRGAPHALPVRKPPHDIGVSATVVGPAIFLQSERRESIEAAASWFLEKHLGARWFMPGPLGEHVPRRAELVLAAGVEVTRPGFVSRDLGVPNDPGREWYGRNRLEARFDHGHNLVGIFRPDDLRRAPEMAPMRSGQRYLPSAPGDFNWQPNLLSRAAIEHAAAVANRAFDAEPRRLSFSLSTNDSYRYDDSPETLRALAPPRFFRHRPDYSDLVFRFTNEVARRVALRHPDRYLPAYAYYWCENTPSFPIARNVVPFLTADRSQWSHADFAAEDRALIERWCKSGAEIVGVYDYFYGAPFLVPRPTLYALKESIPFAHRAGVRAFFAEMNPNWALDGPKPWLAAQLLWSPQRSPDELLEIYFREFWAEAAEPMRAFYRICDQAWLALPGPARWIRYYEDEHQAWIFPPALRAELRAQVHAAAARATGETVRARVTFVARGLDVTDAFADFCTSRDRLARLADAHAAPAELIAAWRTYRAAQARFTETYAAVQQEQPLALASQKIEYYARNRPDARAARTLAETEAGREALGAAPDLPLITLGASPRELSALLANGTESLDDAAWAKLTMRPMATSADIDWSDTNTTWRGRSEPWETRAISLTTNAAGRRVLRLAGCRWEQLSQWAPATPGALYIARADVRAKISPGTEAILMVSFLDEQHRHIGMGQADRVPAGAGVTEVGLCLILRAPPNARWIGFMLRAENQVNDDFAEFSGASLRRWRE